uniref:Uncharacterized protein n=1 Tax=Ditylenchus dipsaci TaxID=166011 RepID=A0A915D1C5_9BILA
MASRKRKRQRPNKLPDSIRKTDRHFSEPQNLADMSQISALQSLLALGQQQNQQPSMLPNVPPSFSTASTVSASTTPIAGGTEIRSEATLRDILQAVAQKQRQPLLTAS